MTPQAAPAAPVDQAEMDRFDAVMNAIGEKVSSETRSHHAYLRAVDRQARRMKPAGWAKVWAKYKATWQRAVAAPDDAFEALYDDLATRQPSFVVDDVMEGMIEVQPYLLDRGANDDTGVIVRIGDIQIGRDTFLEIYRTLEAMGFLAEPELPSWAEKKAADVTADAAAAAPAAA